MDVMYQIGVVDFHTGSVAASQTYRSFILKKVTSTALGSFDIFQGLSLQEREHIASKMVLREYGPRESLTCANEQRTDVFFIISGSVRAHVVSPAGKQVHFDDLTGGMMCGELSAIDNKPRLCEATAETHVLVAVASADVFREIMNEHPAVMSAVMCLLADKVRNQMRRVYEYSTRKVGSRVRLELLRMSKQAANEADISAVKFEDVPTHADIASRISTHREAVTRELKNLEKLGVINWRPGNYVVHDITALEALAQTS